MEAITGSQFQKQIVDLAGIYRKKQIADITQCGVQAVRTKDEWMVIQSLPDFEGVIPGGRQFIFDCKVCSQASFDLSKYRDDTRGARARQLRHMMNRAKFGVTCFFLIHWNPREGKTFSLPEETFALWVTPDSDLWIRFYSGAIKSITREDCREFGVEVKWEVPHGARNPRVNLVDSVFAAMSQSCDHCS